MVVTMEKSASSMVDEWEKKVKDGGGNVELEVGDYMKHVTADIIARTAFGSNYEKGKKVFEEQVTLLDLTDQRNKQRFSAIPGYRFLLVLLVSFLKSLLFMIDLIWRRMLCLIAFFYSWFYGFECSSSSYIDILIMLMCRTPHEYYKLFFFKCKINLSFLM
jgi:hypothetical protein